LKKILNFRLPPGTVRVTNVVLVRPFVKHCTILTDTPWPLSLVGIFQILLFCDVDITLSLDLGYVLKSRTETTFTRHSTEDLDSQ